MITLESNMMHEIKTARKRLYIKYMLSLRCEKIVKSLLNDLRLRHIISGRSIELLEAVTQVQLDTIKIDLEKSGMELLDESNSLLMDRIITLINDVIHDTDQLPNITYDELVNRKIVLGNEHILKIFSEVKGVSILHYIVLQKIERAKELLLYKDVSFSKIAYQLNYKNEGFFIAQFKKTTGLTPDYFRDIKRKRDRHIATQ